MSWPCSSSNGPLHGLPYSRWACTVGSHSITITHGPRARVAMCPVGPQPAWMQMDIVPQAWGKLSPLSTCWKPWGFGWYSSSFMQILQPEALSLTMSASPSNLVTTPLFRNGGLTCHEGWHRHSNTGTHTDVCWLGSAVVVGAPRFPNQA